MFAEKMSVSAIALTILTFMIMTGCTVFSSPGQGMTASAAAVMAGTLTTKRFHSGGPMKNSFAPVIMCLVLVMSALYGVAFAQGSEHGEMAITDMQMHKLHAMMPIFAVASVKLKLGLEKGDVMAVAAEAEKILVALPDLKKSQPHKNVDQRDKFVELVTNLEKTVTTTVSLAKKGDLAGARTAFEKAEDTCAACHAVFRD